MSTSQMVLGSYWSTQKARTWLPWVVGGIVVVAIAFIAFKYRKG